ncbi:MAG: hypothetical protein GY845_39290 [Planctomycetes bacterium]|nr:hypothetical protein [Planctomycetota bacterium]
MKKKGSIFPGLLLIFFGVLLILDRMRFDLRLFQWETIIPLLAILIGLKMWITALATPKKGSVFPGTLFLVLGSFFFMYNYGILDEWFYFDTFWPIFPTALGLAFLSLFLVNFRNWLSLFPAVIFLGIGTISFAIMLDFLDYWTIEDFWYENEDIFYNIGDWAPLLVIVVGLVLIISSIKRAKAKKQINVQLNELKEDNGG